MGWDRHGQTPIPPSKMGVWGGDGSEDGLILDLQTYTIQSIPSMGYGNGGGMGWFSSRKRNAPSRLGG